MTHLAASIRPADRFPSRLPRTHVCRQHALAAVAAGSGVLFRVLPILIAVGFALLLKSLFNGARRLV